MPNEIFETRYQLELFLKNSGKFITDIEKTTLWWSIVTIFWNDLKSNKVTDLQIKGLISQLK